MIDMVLGILLLILLLAIIQFLVRSKKKGHPCIGCPNAAQCKKHNM